jgi:site-specific DNA recombinase
MKSGECRNFADIAIADGTSTAYVCKVIQLAFLSPEILKRILAGSYPPELNAEELMKRRIPFPLDWNAQEKLFGIGSDPAWGVVASSGRH